MPEKMILDYVDVDTLIGFGFNYDEPSVFVPAWEGKKGYTVHAGFYHLSETQILIGWTQGKRREWFFDTIPKMSQERMQREGHEEWRGHVERLTTRKNRVAGRDLYSKLTVLSHHSVPSSNPCPISGEQVL